MSEHLIDLDELVLRCQDKTTKEYIQEAVSCYRAGAFRSCIVSTWNAVVFDFIHKLGQLELTGDRQAKVELETFEKDRSAKKFKEMWEFESKIPQLAQEKYEFISPIERQDLERLHEDRSLCAHPSMHSMGEPFHPTPELARCHLRNAITHLLQHPPVQGKAALNHIWDTIKSEYFPEDVEQAIQSFKTSYLARARKSLIKDIVTGLTKSLLLDNKPVKEQRRMYAALIAVKKLYFNQVEEIVNNKLAQIVNSVSDEEWNQVFFYIRRMDAWQALNSAQQIKAKNYLEAIEKIDTVNSYVLLNSLETKEIEEFAFKQIEQFKNNELSYLIAAIDKKKHLLKSDKIDEIIKIYKPYIVQQFIESGQFWYSANYGHKLLCVSEYLKEEEIKTILDSFCENYQIYGAEKDVPEIMTEFFNKTIHLANSAKSEWLSVREKIEGRDVYTELLNLIDKQFP
ncbi:MAG: hypothetical protein RLZZ04_211 [Cyanobacteriota bacterium]|jgi:hypothetical protein